MSNGEFSGNPRTEWLSENGDERNMRVLELFWYTDPDGRRWEAPANTVINGASIPRTLWSSVGSPYTGAYRRAALVHDAAVGKESVLRADADRMFYFACLCGGCSVLQAKLLYAGVRVGAWATAHRDPTIETTGKAFAPLDGASDGARLPGQQTAQELELRARYTLIAQQLMSSNDDFANTEQLVSHNLATGLAQR
ncbi:MAG: DUF1353 domain-containing protein [Massilia sp.]